LQVKCTLYGVIKLWIPSTTGAKEACDIIKGLHETRTARLFPTRSPVTYGSM
jgi:hypothetical protein